MANKSLISPSWFVAVMALTVCQSALAIILDCEHNPDGTYSCVEIGRPTVTHEASPANRETADIERAYIEQAKRECTYRKPRSRSGGKNSSRALKMEAMKSAQEEYERCLVDKATELKNSQKSN